LRKMSLGSERGTPNMLKWRSGRDSRWQQCWEITTAYNHSEAIVAPPCQSLCTACQRINKLWGTWH
jgi:hypothetical protein